jgi:hypothetical protein
MYSSLLIYSSIVMHCSFSVSESPEPSLGKVGLFQKSNPNLSITFAVNHTIMISLKQYLYSHSVASFYHLVLHIRFERSVTLVLVLMQSERCSSVATSPVSHQSETSTHSVLANQIKPGNSVQTGPTLKMINTVILSHHSERVHTGTGPELPNLVMIREHPT